MLEEHRSIVERAGSRWLHALVAGSGIGEMPSIVAPEWRIRSGLVEVMGDWQFPVEELFMLHAGNRHITLALRLFKEYAQSYAGQWG